MSFDSDLEYIFETAKSDSADASACRQVLISLWEDGEPDGCELLKLLTLEKQSFDAIIAVLNYLYAKRIHLDMFMSTQQIASLVAVNSDSENRAKANNSDPYAHWL